MYLRSRCDPSKCYKGLVTVAKDATDLRDAPFAGNRQFCIRIELVRIQLKLHVNAATSFQYTIQVRFTTPSPGCHRQFQRLIVTQIIVYISSMRCMVCRELAKSMMAEFCARWIYLRELRRSSVKLIATDKMRIIGYYADLYSYSPSSRIRHKPYDQYLRLSIL